jgi:hypothetical protein
MTLALRDNAPNNIAHDRRISELQRTRVGLVCRHETRSRSIKYNIKIGIAGDGLAPPFSEDDSESLNRWNFASVESIPCSAPGN